MTSALTARAEILVKSGDKIAFLGDSITAGGWSNPVGYVHLVIAGLEANGVKAEPIPAGISGHKSNDMLARYQRDVLDKNPDLITISVGINDVWHGFMDNHPARYGPRRVPLPEYRKNVETMLQEARKAHAKVVLFTTTIFEDQPNSIRNLRVAGYNDTLRELARKYHARVADQFAAFMTGWERNRASGARLTSDQVHMAPSGDQLMARTALLAMDVPAHELDRIQPEVLKQAR